MPIPAIDAIIASAIDRCIFPGAVVLVAHDAEILHVAAYGTMTYDPPGNNPVTPATIYDIASLTKMFTATAALQLYDKGNIDLAAPVQAYLPRFRAHDVTVWHLLTHTSGLDLRLSTLRHAGREGLLAAVYDALPPVRLAAASPIPTSIHCCWAKSLPPCMVNRSTGQSTNWSADH